MSDISITVANIKAVNGSTIVDIGVSGGALTAGAAIYKDSNDSNKLKLADANLGLASAQVVGVALHAASTDQPIEFATGGDLTFGGGLTAAVVYIASATAGNIAPVADLTTGWYSTVVGVAISSTVMRLKPIVSNVAAA